MGVFNRLEKGVERALSSTFSRAFKADLKPVDIASSLRREMDDRAASLSRGRTVVPNSFVVLLSSSDLDQVDKWGRQALIDELTSAATEHASDQGYVFVGPVQVNFEHTPDRQAGDFLIRSSSERIAASGFDGSASDPPVAAPDPAAAPHPARDSPHPEPAPHGTHQSAADPIHSRPILDIDGQRYLLTGPVTVIGRGSESDIIVNDSGVSRQHVEIRITTDGVIASDLGSTNGSFVEGHRIEAATLMDGNTITIGRTRMIFWGSQGGAT